MWKLVFTGLAVIALLLASTDPARTQTGPTSVLTVGVYGPDGKPVAGVSVSARSLETGRRYDGGRTGRDGIARIDVALNEHYYVQVSTKDGYATYYTPDTRGREVKFNTGAFIPHAVGFQPYFVTEGGDDAVAAFRRGRAEEGERIAAGLERVRSETFVSGVRLAEMEPAVVANILSRLPAAQREQLEKELDAAKTAEQKKEIADRALAQAQQEFDYLRKRVQSLDEATEASYRNGIDALRNLSAFYFRPIHNAQRGEAAKQALEKIEPARRAAREDQSSLSPGAGEAGGTLRFAVSDPNGRPLPGASVLATHWRTGRTVGGFTDQSGLATLRLPHSGEWRIETSYAGYDRSERTLTVGTPTSPTGTIVERLGRARAPFTPRSTVTGQAIQRTGEMDRIPQGTRSTVPTGVRFSALGSAVSTWTPSVPLFPLFQGGNPTGAFLQNLETDITGGQFRLGVSWTAPRPWAIGGFTPRFSFGISGSLLSASASSSAGQVQIPAGQNANVFTVDGRNVFILNNLQNFQFDYDYDEFDVAGSARAVTPLSDNVSLYTAFSLGYRNVGTASSIGFLNFNNVNTIDTDLDYDGPEIEFRAGPIWRVREDLSIRLYGTIGAWFIDADLRSNQTVGNASFAASASEQETSLTYGAGLDLTYRPWGPGHMSLRAFFNYEHASRVPFARYPTALNQPISIGFASQDRIAGGVKLSVPFSDIEYLFSR